MTEEGTRYEGGLADGGALKTRGEGSPYRRFFAYEFSPSSNLTLIRVSGQVRVGNPGIQAVLTYAEPQGGNPNILLLRLDLFQRPGFWPEVVVYVPADYTGISEEGPYDQVQITNPYLGDITIPVFH